MCGARPKLRSAKPLVIKHTAAVSALTRRSQWAQALSRFGTAFGERGLSPDAPALGAGLAACAKGAQWAQALHLFTSAAVKNAACFGTLLHAFASAARWHEALSSLAAAEDPDIVAFNTTINACTRGAAWPAALGVFAEAEARRLPATSVTYNTTATACLRGSLWHVAMELARRGEEVEAEGASPASLGAALASCERASLWDKAIWLLYKAGSTDSWDVAAGGSAVASCGALQWAQALSLFETLSSYALVDYVTRSSLVTVCRRAWQWRTAAALAASPAADPATIALGIDVCEAAQAPSSHRQRLRRCLIRRALGTTAKDPGAIRYGELVTASGTLQLGAILAGRRLLDRRIYEVVQSALHRLPFDVQLRTKYPDAKLATDEACSARACQRLLGGRRSFATLAVRNAATSVRLLRDGGRQLVTSSYLVSYGDSRDVVNQKNRELRSRLASMPWPRLTSIELAGKDYALPWKFSKEFVDTDAQRLTNREQNTEYLAGFFDGDGCARCTTPLTGVELTVEQAVDGAQVLLQFGSTFGGSMRRQRDGHGLVKPTMAWTIFGTTARDAASRLAECSITKRRQLEIVANWPEAAATRESCDRELRMLKRCDSGTAGNVSWRYFAGFFDAEGCIRCPGGECLQLRVGQKYITVLNCLQTFLHREIGSQGSIVKCSRSYFELIVSTTSTCKLILEKLLLVGMARKAAQAELALSLNRQNTAQVRSAMKKLVGNQMFGRNLDGDGQERARTIRNAQQQVMRLRQRGLQEAADALFAQVEVLKTEHGLLKAQNENRQLQEYMHKLESMTADFQKVWSSYRCFGGARTIRLRVSSVRDELRSLREERTAKAREGALEAKGLASFRLNKTEGGLQTKWPS
ncbi:unnamed protein product [Symbiodinium sp. CCMP2592]|nr:unnamed protein product [Symbiodinium sp. CCMP2592]